MNSKEARQTASDSKYYYKKDPSFKTSIIKIDKIFGIIIHATNNDSVIESYKGLFENEEQYDSYAASYRKYLEQCTICKMKYDVAIFYPEGISASGKPLSKCMVTYTFELFKKLIFNA